jgi:N-acyl-D-aspartate/D-glutamate deacylase
VNKMTGFPAARLRFANRGRIALGAPADIVVFDPATIRDRSTFTDQFQYPDGIVAVLVNGVFALRDRSRTTLRSGVSVRPST